MRVALFNIKHQQSVLAEHSRNDFNFQAQSSINRNDLREFSKSLGPESIIYLLEPLLRQGQSQHR